MLSGELTWTNNVDLQPRNERHSDFVFQITPGLRVDYQSARARLNGYIGAPIVLYARTGGDSNSVMPLVDLSGNVEVVKDFFFIDAAANVSQTYYNPFGPRPPGLANATDNRYTAGSYSVAPYLQGVIGGNVRYRLRDENLWSNLSDAPTGANSLYTNVLTGSIDREPTPIGWGADISRTSYQYSDQERSQLLEQARLRGVYQPSPAWRFFVTGGYEHNNFAFTEYDGATYGLGFTWRPDERSLLDAGWEHRFFGESYYLLFNHRSPLTALSLRASRNVTNYPEQLASLPAGSFLPGILNQLLASRIPDPAERARFIITYLRERGLPFVLSDPLNLYAQQVYLQESASATYGILGVRNSIFFSVYRNRTEPITGSGVAIPPQLGGFSDNTEYGGGAVWTYALTATASLSLSGDAVRTEANEPFTGRSDQWSLRLTLTRPISPRTTAYAGARYVSFDSNLQDGYREAAVFVGASHTFQ